MYVHVLSSGGVEGFPRALLVNNLLDQLRSRKPRVAKKTTPVPAPPPGDGTKLLKMDMCSTHPDQAIQFCCTEPDCRQLAICALCLVQKHVQHKVELIVIDQVEKTVKEVETRRQTEHDIVVDKVQRVLSVKDRVAKNREIMNGQIEKRAAEYIETVRQVVLCLKKEVESQSNLQIEKASEEINRLLAQKTQLEAMAITPGSSMGQVMREGPKLLELLRHMWSRDLWEFWCDLPVLAATSFPPTLYLGKDPSLTVIEAVRESVTSDLEAAHQEQRQVSA